ncbi:damage-inducible protein DinB [Mesobacillus campisalis]|uniref:Damage-inducible protein DinB n=1 Tax=Mesobacillus campisalis TaxID=1408103 RepID=A0A0M2SR48_9BACI|nr:DinB family protein [Mesobacillus campisalis]KKK36151.1 damage-inducible protein DinB [Mesobacillus campisalis]
MENTKGFTSGWMSHRKALIELLDTLNDGQLNYKPWENGMTLSELVLHTTGATAMFAQTVKNGEFTPPSGPNAVESVQKLKEVVQEQTELTQAVLESLTGEQLGKLIDFSGMKMTGSVMLETARDHEIHHKGQLFTYARMLGIEELPFFVSRA